MTRLSRFAMPLLALCVAAVPVASAQDSIALREIRELRAMVEKQGRQIEALAAQVAKLNQTLEKTEAGAIPVATPVAPPPAAEFSADVPRAQPVEGKRHVVVKGETLTSIAKQYNITTPELQKANKAVEERKLQIGQTLTIPTPPTPDPPTEKKENP